MWIAGGVAEAGPAVDEPAIVMGNSVVSAKPTAKVGGVGCFGAEVLAAVLDSGGARCRKSFENGLPPGEEGWALE